MFDLGWTELLLIGIVALVVVGPKDLPAMFRALGRATAKARGMAREFQRAMEEAADESGVRDVGKDLRKMTSSRNLGLDRLRDATTGWDKWEPDKTAAARQKADQADQAEPEPRKLSEERAEAGRKSHDAGEPAPADREEQAPEGDPAARAPEPEATPPQIEDAPGKRQA